MTPALPQRPLVVGFGVAGQAVAAALVRHGTTPVVADDRPTDALRGAAADLGLDLRTLDPAALADEVGRADAVFPAPGLPERHPVFALARSAGVPLRSELDLAAAIDDRPCLAITGTNGKTTVTTMVTEMLRASGRRAVEAGNTDVPLVAAVADPEPEVFVVEASSFRLTSTTAFRPLVGTWLNFAPDHLDVHQDLGAYEDAKARVWANLAPGGVAVANADDPVVARRAADLPARQTFGVEQPADWTVRDGRLVGPDGLDLVAIEDLPRALPHDIANGLAAAATALGGGGTVEGVRSVLRSFAGLPHRVQLVAEVGGVRWYDDSKATAPHATVAALGGFASAVLIAGGRNKGLDLTALAATAPHLRAVVAIGEAAPDVAAAFAGARPVVTAHSMAEAVKTAADLARPGDAVVLSPACASFDWYRSYAERGDDFQREVRALEVGAA